ncbi:unnamed protein product [Amoebophrya sp. A25]|nr:unnamed protein product [Amoebophrya sp. A25]|eukprot:GSA25T00021795001.1
MAARFASYVRNQEHILPILVAAGTNGTRYLLCDGASQYYFNTASSEPRQHQDNIRKVTNGNNAVARALKDSESPTSFNKEHVVNEHSSSRKATSSCSSTTSPISWSRACAFGLFGAIYAGGPGYAIYNILYPRHLKFVQAKPLLGSFFDCLVQTPLVFLPVFYLVKESVLLPPAAEKTKTEGSILAGSSSAQRAFQKYTENVVRDTAVAGAVWIPLMYVAFRYVPLRWRWPYMSGTGVFWAFIFNYVQFQ